MKTKVKGREYRMKNKRVFIGEGDSGLIHIVFKKLYNVDDLCGNETNYPYNYVIRTKLGKKCIFVTNLAITKEAFGCLGDYFVNVFLPENQKHI